MDHPITFYYFILLILVFLRHSADSSTKHVFKRISAEGVHSSRCGGTCQTVDFKHSLRNRHRCAFADGRLYFLSLKGKRQPTFGSYHETALHGGYLSSYNGLLFSSSTTRRPENNNNSSSFTSSNLWSHYHFDVIDKNENREDAFFVLKNNLFLLIYTRFGNVTFRRLLKWQQHRRTAGEADNNPQGKWTSVHLQVDERSEFRDVANGNTSSSIQNGGLAWTTLDMVHHHQDGDHGQQDPTTPTTSNRARAYLAATDGWGRIKVSELEVHFDDNSIDSDSDDVVVVRSAVIRFVTEDDGTAVNFAGAILALAHRAGVLYAFYGTRGCGFHWEKRSLITIDLNDHHNDSFPPSIDHTDLSGGDRSPPWAFNGPALVEQDGPNWMMFGGNVAAGGEAGVEFDRRVWIFNLDTRRWKKSKWARLPDRLNIYETCSAIDRRSRTVYLADFHNIYKVPLDRL